MVSFDTWRLSSLIPNWAYIVMMAVVFALAAMAIARNRRRQLQLRKDLLDASRFFGE